MDKINFKRISIEGFGSFVEPVNFNLDRQGVNLIKGKNGNGKTTLFSALLWAVYKMNLKGVTNDSVVSWEWVRTEAFRGTRVIIEWDKGNTDYMVARHIDFKGTTKGIAAKSALMIFEKSKDEPEFTKAHLLGSEQHKGDQQEYINRVIGIDAKTFLNSILFGQRMKRLVESENSEKRDLFDKLFELEFIELAKEKAKAESQKLALSIVAYSKTIEAKELEMSGLKEQIESGKAILNTFEIQKKERLSTLDTTLQAAEKEFEELDAEHKKLTAASEKFEELNAELDKKKVEAKELETKLNKAKDDEAIKGREMGDIEALITRLNVEAKRLIEVSNAEYKKFKEATARAGEIKKLAESYDVEAVQKLETLITADGTAHRLILDNIATYARQVKDSEAELVKAKTNIAKYENDLKNVATTCVTCEGPLNGAQVATAKGNIRKLIESESNVVTALDKNYATYLKKWEDEVATGNTLNEKTKKSKEALVTLIESQKEAKKAFDELADLNTQLTKLKKTLDDTTKLSKENDAEVKAKAEALIIVHGERDKFKKDITLLGSSLTASNQAVLDCEGTITESREANNKLQVVVAKAKGVIKEITTAKKSIETEQAVQPPKVELEKMQEQINDCIDELEIADAGLINDKAELVRVNWWIEKGFSSGGLKSFVFNAMLSQLNLYVEKYAARLGIRVKFSVDLTKVSKPFVTTCFIGEHEIDYKDFSGGQKQRLDTVLAFAMHDLISQRSNINILIMDEAMEGLDDEGVQIVFDLIRIKAEGRCVFIISHLVNLDALNCKTINIESEEVEGHPGSVRSYIN